MNDDIQLPPLQQAPPMYVYSGTDLESYARAAVLTDRERRAFVDNERIAELEDEVHDLTIELTRARSMKPVVHSARVVLTPDGYAWSHGGAAECPPPKRAGRKAMTAAEAVAIARVELSAMTLLAALCECAERLPSRHPLQPIVRAALREAVPLDGGER